MATDRVDNSSETSGTLNKEAWDKWNTLAAAVSRFASFLIAANDSPTVCKNAADYICDGTADDVQIQAAIDALPTVGGCLLFAPGNYASIANINLVSNLLLLGINAKITSTADYCFFGTDVTEVEIAGLHIDHSGGTTSVSSAILIEAVDAVCRNIKIHDCEIEDFRRAGIHIKMRPINVGPAGATYGFNGVFLKRNYIHDSDQGTRGTDGNGIQVARGYMENVRITDNTVEDMLSMGIFVGSDVGYSYFYDVKIENNHIKEIPDYGIDVSGLIDTEISGNYIYNSDATIDELTKGIFVEEAAIMASSDLKIEHNTIDGAGIEAIDVYSDNDYVDINYNTTRRVLNPTATGAVHIAAVGDYHTVIGNRCYGDEDGSPTQGIVVGDYALVADNYLEDMTDHAIGVQYSSSIYENNRIINPIKNGIGASAGDYNIIRGNYIKNALASYAGIKEWGTADNNYILYNDLLDCVATQQIVTSGASTVVRYNVGYITENSGTATLVNGQTSIAVTHGLSATPAAGDIMVTPIEGWGSAASFYIDTYSSTQFTIHVNADPGADVDFAWKALIL